MTSQPSAGGWSQGQQPQQPPQPMWQSQYGPNQPTTTASLAGTHKQVIPPAPAERIRLGVGAVLVLCGFLTLLSLLFSMVNLDSPQLGQGVSLKPFKGVDLGHMADAMPSDGGPFFDIASSMAKLTGVMSLLAAMLFIAAGIVLILRRMVRLTTGMTVGALYLCAVACIPEGILTGLWKRVDSSRDLLLNSIRTWEDTSSSDIDEASAFLSSTSLHGGAGTHLLITAEVLGAIALIVLVGWILVRVFKTMKGATK